MSYTVVSADAGEPARVRRTEILRDAGFHILDTASGTDAVRIVSETQPGLVILAIELAGMDGLEACRRLKGDPKTAGVPVLHIIARDAAGDGYAASIESGADAYLEEPVEPGVLISVINALLSRKSAAADALAQRTAGLEAVLNSLENAVFVYDAEGKLILTNPAARALYSIDVAAEGVEAAERRLRIRRTDGSDMPTCEFPFRRALAGEHVAHQQYLFAGRDGGDRVGEATAIPLVMNGRIDGAVAFATDVTERTRAEKSLRQSEERFLKAFRSSPAALAITDVRDGTYVDVNESYQRLTGYSRDELLGHKITDLNIYLHAEQRAEIIQLMRQAGKIDGLELSLRRKDGQLIDTIASLDVIQDGDRNLFLSSLIDITNRKRAEAALRESEQKYHTLFANMAEEGHLWKLVRDERGRVKTWTLVDANPAALKTWGRAIEDIKGKTADEIFGPGSTDHYMPVVQKIVTEGIPYSYEDYFPNLDKDFRFTSVPLGDFFITTGADITRVKRAEQALLESERRFRLALRNAPVSVAVQDRDLRYIWAYNQRTAAPEEVIGRTDDEIFTPDEAARVTAIKRRVLQEGVEVHEQMWLDRPGGRVFLDVFWEPIRDEAGQVVGVGSATVELTPMKLAEEALRESEAHYRTLSETMLQGVVYQDADGKILSMNPAAVRILGKTPAEFLGTSSVDQEHDTINEDGSPFPGADHPAMIALRTGREVRNVAMGIYNPREKQYRWIDVTAVPLIRPGESRPYQVYTVFEDITERKRSEEALRQSQETIEAFFALSPGILNIEDDEFRYIKTDSLTPAYFGLDRDSIVGKSVQELAPGFMEEFGPMMKEVIETGRPKLDIEVKSSLPNRANEVAYWRASYFPVPIPGGKRGIGIMGVEITDIKRAEEALRESEDRFRTLANAIPQLCWMADADGRIFWYNQRWYDYTGTTLEQMEGWGWESVHDPEMLPKVVERWRASLSTGEPFDMVFPLRGADGIFRPFLTRVVPMRDHEGKIARWFGTNTDVSEQLRTEEALRRSNQDLEQFAYAASHDLQEPLRMISIYTEMLARVYRGHADQQAEQFIAWTLAGTRRMHALLQGLLDYSRVSNSDMASAVMVDSFDALMTALRNLESAIEESGAVITYDPLPRVRIPEVYLVQLFQNLVANAIRYRSAQRPRIHVSVAGAGTWRRFSVSDNGIGIDPKYFDYIFKVFKRIQTDSDTGTGIGLAICKRIVERQGGRIWVESASGQGTTFHFTLQAAPDAAPRSG
jgi:PAS domain S-box-containing protein